MRRVVPVQELLGTLKALAHIRPPKRNFADWDRFLEQCREAGVAAVYGNERGEMTGGFVTPLGYALLRRWRWLRDSRAAGLDYEAAEMAFYVGLERDKAALTAAEREREKTVQAATHELAEGPDATEMFAHAKDLGL